MSLDPRVVEDPFELDSLFLNSARHLNTFGSISAHLVGGTRFRARIVTVHIDSWFLLEAIVDLADLSVKSTGQCDLRAELGDMRELQSRLDLRLTSRLALCSVCCRRHVLFVCSLKAAQTH